MAELPLAAPAQRRRSLVEARPLAVAATFAFLAAVPALAELAGEPFYVTLFTRIMIWAIAAVSLDLILGYGGMVSFGHAAFVGVGAYVTGISVWHVTNGEPLLTWPVALDGTDDPFLLWPVAILAAAAVALVIGLISLRTSGIYFIMITLAFAQMLYFLAVALQKYGGEDGFQVASQWSLRLAGLRPKTTFYYFVLIALGLVLLFCRRLVASRFGMVIRGVRQNERRMQAIGFPAYRYKLAAFVIAGALAGFAGILLANQQSYVSPANMSWVRSGELIIMVVLGGMGTLYGAVLGAAAYLLLELALGSWTIHWQAIFGPVLILVVLFAKRGLFGLLPERRDER